MHVELVRGSRAGSVRIDHRWVCRRIERAPAKLCHIHIAGIIGGEYERPAFTEVNLYRGPNDTRSLVRATAHTGAVPPVASVAAYVRECGRIALPGISNREKEIRL